MYKFKIKIYLLIAIFCFVINKKVNSIEEFTEYQVKNYIEYFSFKNEYSEEVDYIPDIIIFIENSNYYSDYSDVSILRISKIKSKEYNLRGINTIILDKVVNEGKGEYLLKFKNYIGAKFFIYNSIHSFPLNDFSKEFYLFEYQNIPNLNLKFHSDVLESDTEINVFPLSFITIKKIIDEKDEILELNNNKIKLIKGAKYTIEYNKTDEDNLFFCVKKTNIIKYQKEEKKINLFYNISNYILINTNEYKSEEIYIYLYNIQYSFLLEIEEYSIDNNKIEEIELDKIEYYNKFEEYSKYPITINITSISNNNKYLLLKIINKEKYYYYYTNFIFKVFENYIISTNKTIINSETLFIYKQKYLGFIFSNQKNLRIFENKEIKSTIFHKETSYFPFIILPSEIPININMYQYFNYNEIYINKFIYKCHLSYLFSSVFDKKLLLFNVNKKTTIKIKTYFGEPIIFYSDNFNNDTIKNINQFGYKNLKKMSLEGDIMTFDSDFIIYIYPYEESYIDILINEEEDLIIHNEDSIKYLIENKEYSLEANNLIINIEEDYDSNLYIYDLKGNILNKLDINNKMTKINETNGDLLLKSEKNVTINLYYKINYIFEFENIHIIEFPIEKIGKIMIIEIISYNSDYFYYAMNYGYNNYISYNTKKLATNQKYFLIENPYSKMENYNEKLRYYIILMNNDIKYEIKYINQYQKEKNKFYYRINPNEDYAIVSENNFFSNYSTNEILFCKNKNITVDIIQIDKNELQYSDNNDFLFGVFKKSLYIFNAESEFIFLQKETINKYLDTLFPIYYYIPKIDDLLISVLI